MVVWIVLACFVAPGFAHGLMGQPRAMWIAFGAVMLAAAATAFTVWAFALVIAVSLGVIVDAVRRYRRLRPNIRWSVPHAMAPFGASVLVALLLRMFVVEAFKIPSSAMYPTLEIGDHVFVVKWRTHHAGDLIAFRQPCQPDRDYLKRIIAVAGQTIEIRCNIVYVDGKPLPHTLIDRDATYEDTIEDLDGTGTHKARKRASRYREQVRGRSFDIFSDPGEPARDEARKAGALLEGDAKDFPQSILYNCETSTDPYSKHPANQAPGTIVDVAPEGRDPCVPRRHYVVPEGHVFVLGDNRANSNDSRYWGSVPVENIKGVAVGIWWPWRRLGGVE